MQKRRAGGRLRRLGVLAALALVAQLAGCAHSPAKLPKCSGSAVPINTPAATGSVSGER